jgi:carbamoyl-phosphate synthase large subunit
VTGKTLACFEPALDYCVVKIPRWPFDKFTSADRRITTQMKATGEVMALDRSFESALMKAVRSLEIGAQSLRYKGASLWTDMQIETLLATPTDERLFAIAEGFRRGMMVEEISQLAHYDRWFLVKIRNIVAMEATLEDNAAALDTDAGKALLRDAKHLGFTDRTIGDLTGRTEAQIRDLRKSLGIIPTFKIVDTCAAEFEATTPYYYSCYDKEDER